MGTSRPATWLRWVGLAGATMQIGCVVDLSSKVELDGGSPSVEASLADAPMTSDASRDAAPDLVVMRDAAIPCSETVACPQPFTCCGGTCVDITSDPRHCGSCGQICADTQFCTSTACSDTVFASVCDNPHVTVIKDPYDTDNNAAATIGDALMGTCMLAPMVMARDQGAPGVLDPAGRPLAGGGTSYLAGGGSYGQHVIDYLDRAGLTSVYFINNGTMFGFRNRHTTQDLVWAPASTLTESHDFFLAQVVVEPVSGTLCVSVLGLFAPGTSAGAYWVAAEMIPKRAMYTDSWYIFEWTDGGDKIPNATDTFRLVDHGR